MDPWNGGTEWFPRSYFLSAISSRISAMLDRFMSPVLTLIFPQACRSCGANVESIRDGVACDACWDATHLFSTGDSICSKCGAFQGSNSDHAGSTSCGQCAEASYEFARAAGIYGKALAATVIELKKTPHLPVRARRAFLGALDRAEILETSLILPVPLSQRRLLERGFNQAEILANMASGHLRIQLNVHILKRKTHTPIHRAAMDKKARESTVRNAFDIRHRSLIEGKNILLIDDVFTSGATISACSKVLKKNGAGKVYAFTLARAVM
jgi:ComF family protein